MPHLDTSSESSALRSSSTQDCREPVHMEELLFALEEFPFTLEELLLSSRLLATVSVESSSSLTRAPWITRKALKLNQANNWRGRVYSIGSETDNHTCSSLTQ